MATVPRKLSSSGIYHIMVRGADKRVIFDDNDDRLTFLRYFRDALGKARKPEGAAEAGRTVPAAAPSRAPVAPAPASGPMVFPRRSSACTVYAWCLMTNHVHLLMGMELGALSCLMRTVTQRYARYYNARHGRVGHLYEGRFRSEPINDEPHFLTVVRYIHQNPVKALMTADCRYAWSSYGEFLGGPGPTDTDSVLAAFGGLESFLQFHGTVAFDDRCLELPLQVSDAEARSYASKLIGKKRLENIDRLDLRERDACLRMLKNCMIPCTQIAAITPLSLSTVYRA